MSRAVAVATCRPTRNARKNDSGRAWTLDRLSQPTTVGRTTAWPRLEIGNSSVMPWVRPITSACRYVITRASLGRAPEDIVRDEERPRRGAMGETYVWEMRNPDGGAFGLEFARGTSSPTDTILVHAAPSRLNVEVRTWEGEVVAKGRNL